MAGPRRDIFRGAVSPAAFAGKGKDRSQRPYFGLVKNRSGIAITEPYLCTASRKLAISAAVKGKTTLEEEVLMHKDIFRHSSTRRTITRFVGAILIAVSIESLLLMFKAALGEGDQLIKAVWMMLAAVGLLMALGVYVYLGSKAEETLTEKKR